MSAVLSSVVLAAASVHTKGVNIEGVFATAASAATLIVIALVPSIRWFTRGMKERAAAESVKQRDAFEKIVDEKITPRFDKIETEIAKLWSGYSALDVRLTSVESAAQGRREILDLMAAGNPKQGEVGERGAKGDRGDTGS